jgi:hypothetical protein
MCARNADGRMAVCYHAAVCYHFHGQAASVIASPLCSKHRSRLVGMDEDLNVTDQGLTLVRPRPESTGVAGRWHSRPRRRRGCEQSIRREASVRFWK